jgi:predicted dehydrogenase
LAGTILPHVHAAEDNTLQIAFIGCGGRGVGALQNALSTKNGPTKLVAMADVFPDRLNSAHGHLHEHFASQMDVPDERKFIGFDAYKKAMDCLRPGDVVILTTPPAFRWVHFAYAIEKNLNVFMEKPVSVDAPTTRRMIALGKEAKKKGLKVGVGLMARHCLLRKELFNRIQDGEIGRLITMRAYRMHGPTGSAFSGPVPKEMSELHYQIRRFHSFIWASGGLFNDFYIHNIDEACWMKNAWPVRAQALGGRQYRGNAIDQNFDHYSVEYTFGDGTKLFLEGRTIEGCYANHATYAHGSEGYAVISEGGHSPARTRLYHGDQPDPSKLIWHGPKEEPDPYQLEWEDLTSAIRNDFLYNEVERGAMASLVSSLGRVAAHTGQLVTLDEYMQSDFELAPGVDKLTLDGPAPLPADKDGKYPLPKPGITTKREYEG